FRCWDRDRRSPGAGAIYPPPMGPSARDIPRRQPQNLSGRSIWLRAARSAAPTRFPPCTDEDNRAAQSVATGSAQALDLRERRGDKRTKRVVGEGVDRADVDLAKDVSIGAI